MTAAFAAFQSVGPRPSWYSATRDASEGLVTWPTLSGALNTGHIAPIGPVFVDSVHRDFRLTVKCTGFDDLVIQSNLYLNVRMGGMYDPFWYEAAAYFMNPGEAAAAAST